jgi:hypothetical protein
MRRILLNSLRLNAVTINSAGERWRGSHAGAPPVVPDVPDIPEEPDVPSDPDVDENGYIIFADAEVKRVLLAKGVGDGVGITTEDAAEVTSIGVWFANNAEITSFNELEKFTSVRSLNKGAFQGCTSLVSLGLHNIETFGVYSVECPSLTYNELILPNARSVGQYAFNKTKIKSLQLPNIESYTAGNVYYSTWGDRDYIEEIILSDNITILNGYTFYSHSLLKNIGVNWEGVTSIGKAALSNCSSFSQNFILRSASQIGESCFEASGILSIVAPSVSSIANYAFRYCNKLRYAVLSKVIASIGSYAFRGCEVMQALVIPVVTPPALGTSVFMSPNNCLIYVPDASVSAYREASGWSAYASRIFPVSQLATDNPDLYNEIKGYL